VCVAADVLPEPTDDVITHKSRDVNTRCDDMRKNTQTDDISNCPSSTIQHEVIALSSNWSY